MSSSASLFSQRLKEGIGLASKTADADITSGVGKLTELERDVGILRKVLETTNKALNVQVPAAKSQMVGVISELAEKLVGLDSESSTFIKVFHDVHKYMDKDLPDKLNIAFEKAVLQPLDEWLKSLTDVKAEVKVADEKRLVYDHYKDKVEGLREAKRKQQQRGKVVDRSTEERLSRNEEKLQSAEAEYTTMRDSAVGKLIHVFQEAEFQLEAVLLRVMQYEMQVTKDTTNAVRSFEGAVPTLLARVKDHKSAAVGSGPTESCIRYAREQREAGKSVSFESLLDIVAAARKILPTSGTTVPVATTASVDTPVVAHPATAKSASAGATKAVAPVPALSSDSSWETSFEAVPAKPAPAAAPAPAPAPSVQAEASSKGNSFGFGNAGSPKAQPTKSSAPANPFASPDSTSSTTSTTGKIRALLGNPFGTSAPKTEALPSSDSGDAFAHSDSFSADPIAPARVDTAVTSSTKSTVTGSHSFDPFSAQPSAPAQTFPETDFSFQGFESTAPAPTSKTIKPLPAATGSLSLKPPAASASSATRKRPTLPGQSSTNAAPAPSNPFGVGPSVTSDPFAIPQSASASSIDLGSNSSSFAGLPAPAAVGNPFGGGWDSFGSETPPPVPPRTAPAGVSAAQSHSADPTDPFGGLM